MSRMTTSEVPPVQADDVASARVGPAGLIVYLVLGIAFGILLIKSEVVSWFRIQEMFRFQGIHMYGILGSAVMVAALSLALIRRLDLRTAHGLPMVLTPKQPGSYRYALGGAVFGLGWAFTGACPGPIFALVGYGVGPFVIVLIAALAGTWTYGKFRHRLPH
jgi:uncharacterized protein